MNDVLINELAKAEYLIVFFIVTEKSKHHGFELVFNVRCLLTLAYVKHQTSWYKFSVFL